jgi:hypothetical protein
MAAPTRESPFPTVVLQHELPDGTTHFDWLLGVEPEGEKPLISFRTEERPDQITESRWIDLESRPDHRPDFLHIEGSLDGDRGVVTQLAKGEIFVWKEVSNGWNLMVEWDNKSVTEFEVVMLKGAVAFRRVLEDQSQPPLPDPSLAGDVPIEGAEGPAGLTKITAFGSEQKEDTSWSRNPNTTGTDAKHVRTFHSKLTDDALTYLDKQVNEWLDENPKYEVKIVSTTIGTFTGKVKEPHLICQIWV